MDELAKIAFARRYIWRGCKLYLHGSNIKIGNADKESDLTCQVLPDFLIKCCVLCYNIFMSNCYDYGKPLNSDIRSVVRFFDTPCKQRHKNWCDRVIAVS